jgi:hypothetical protein
MNMSANPAPDRGGMAWMFEQMFRLPMVAFIYTMEMMVKTMRGLQHMAESGSGTQVLAAIQRPQQDDSPAEAPPASGSVPQPGTESVSVGAEQRAEANLKEKRHMPDTNLNDDMLKLVRYKILFVKREYETAFDEREDLVSDNMSSSAFTAWKIAEFVQNIHDYRLPAKWENRSYPESWGKAERYFLTDKDRADARYSNVPQNRLKALPEEDKKYLRVYFEVLERYPREKFKYEEQQIEILRDIAKELKQKA